ncbi:MAG TPA: response regulator transcription factor [Nocardioides sp.]|uniref:response regulator transcription factor n=1 Tax=Nocardioides sp. TaxID=35761 RepID=UPI002B7644C0|nr:response regulator transcription factor [Nocardioides sp.]HQR26785.1 response regulator transcription factor [Nocardioides sp.]
MRVLVVDDERPLAEALRRGLTDEGFVVDVAYDGIVGLATARYGDYDVVVLDIMLPGMHGYDVLKELRRHEVWTPVLMLTAKDGEFDQTDAFDLGADDYLTKPFSFPVLVARLRALVRRGAPQRPVVLRCGDLSLDPVGRTVRRGETMIDLTPREFSLLQFLIRRCGDAVTKADILANVWDTDYPGSDNLVEVYVGYVRRKIDAPFGTSSLETVRGVGYRLVPVIGAAGA